MLAADSNLMPLAGGTDIIPKMHKQPHIEQLKSGDPAPPSTREEVVLLNLSNIEELFGLTAENHQIKIGALTTHTEIAINQLIKTYFPILAEAAAVIGSVQIRNRGTIGGNIVNASPAADLVAPLVAIGAKLVLTSPNGKRQIDVEQFAISPGKTIKQSDELLSVVSLALPSGRNIQFFKRLAPRKAQGISKVSLAFFANLEDDILSGVRIALGAVGPTVISAQKTACLLEQKVVDVALIQQAMELIKSEAMPISDVRSTAEYRRAMVGELLRQGLEEALI